MNYLEIDIRVLPPEPYRGILVALLAESGFESFTEYSTGLKAYIQKTEFDRSDFEQVLGSLKDCTMDWDIQEIEHKNWNAEWERSYRPVIVSDNCVIRAFFHDAMPDFEYEILIQPQMSFGTGHHPTTLLMMRQLLELDVAGSSLIDLGTGTGVLAILAEKMGADRILATDIEDHIVTNAKDNVRHNDCVNIRVDKAELARTEKGEYGFILANINLNILLEGLATLVELAEQGATVLMSGFYESDADKLIQNAQEYGLQFEDLNTHERWAVVRFTYDTVFA